ncbi:MAG: ABC transporter permease [Candidatus Hydrogenedentes bacterium]|nr:ABC transporter permease [Candidatus Hydrogenedentota bacterium]
MTVWHIAWNYLWSRKLTTFLTILSVALGVGLITSVLLMRDETERRFVEEGQAFDVAIGAVGSTQQLVLSSVYFIGQPAGNIPYSIYEKVKKDEEVVAAFPIGMGDSYRGFRIVGTNRELMEFDWTNRITGEERNTYKLAEGRYFEKPFEAVIGSTVAKELGLKVGDTFASTHGLMEVQGVEHHKDTPYTVVGILVPSGTPNDRILFTQLDSIWHAHEHEYGTSSLTGSTPTGLNGAEAGHEEEAAPPADEYAEGQHVGEEHHDHETTAVLIVLDSPGQRLQFIPRIMRENPGVVAADPIREVQRLYEQLLGTARQVLLAIGYLVAVISSISILIGLYLAIVQRRRDLAIMRALGASSGEVFGAVLIEAFWVTLMGIGAGWVVGTGLTYGLGMYLTERIGFAVSAFRPSPDMITAYSVVLLMGMLAGILPAWQAYRTDITRGLAEL